VEPASKKSKPDWTGLSGEAGGRRLNLEKGGPKSYRRHNRMDTIAFNEEA